MRITDTVTLGEARVNDAGYLEANARTARVGVQAYLGSEVGRPDLDAVNVYRDEAEVFAKRSLDTFSRLPITNDHPAEPVTAKNWRDHAVGTTGDEVLRDGEFLKIGLKITDASAVDAVHAGKRELSVGYTTDLVWDEGIAPDGTPYQARQTAIVADHIAIVARGRAGTEVRIGDGAAQWGASPIITADGKEPDMPDTLRTVVVDGLSVSVTDQGAQAIEKLTGERNDARKSLADAEKSHVDAIKAKDEEIGKLTAKAKKLEDAAPKPADLDKMVADRVALVTTAKAVVADVKCEGLSDAAIRKAVVASKLGEEIVANASDDMIAGMFKAVAADAKPADPLRSTGPIKANDGAGAWTDDAFKSAGVKMKEAS